MKAIKITSILLLLLTSFESFSKVQDSIYYNRLFYTCKAWGHVKYYHTETANGSINWDDELLNAVNSIKNTVSNDSFNLLVLQMLYNAGEMGINSGTSPVIPDSLNNNSDYLWIQNPIYSDSVKSILDTIRNRFRPQSNVYVGEAWSGGNPIFDTDNLYNSEESFPTEDKRILALFRYWNIINYFFPYKDIMDQKWDSTLVEFIPQIVEASDALSYNLAFKRLTTRINDSHAFFSSPTFGTWLGYLYPPLQARFIEGEMVITKVLPEITEVQVGDIIKKIDELDIYKLRDSLRKYASGSNEVIIERELNDMILRGDDGSFSLTVDNGSNTHTESLNRNSSHYSSLRMDTSPIWKDTTIDGSCNFGIVDMGRLEKDDIFSMFTDLWDTDAIIFDVRNYPNGTLAWLINNLFLSSFHMASFTTPDINYPGRLVWDEVYMGIGNPDPYSGKVIILFDERTQSQAEYTCMGLEQVPGAVKIGSTTSAADGNVAKIFLPGQIVTYATFLGTFYPDYTPTQRVGIIPDYEVHPTISGIRAGQDEVMSFALKCNLVGINEIETSIAMKLYPNPARHEITYDLADDTPTLLEIYDMKGLKVKTINTNAPNGKIDISELGEGIYAIKVFTSKSTLTKLIVKH